MHRSGIVRRCAPALALVCLAACGGRRGGGPRIDGGASDGAVRDGGGPTACTSDTMCDDGVACTDDTCSSGGSCRHVIVPARCPAGEICDRDVGCVPGRPCAVDSDCSDDDPCTVGETCSDSVRVCVSQTLDGDHDGDPPRVCGGTDCDDSDGTIHDMASELCNGVDEDCDGIVDESGRCGEGMSCVGGECVCDPPLDTCFGIVCTDTATDPSNCGTCGNFCETGSTCSAGVCSCSGGLTSCSGSCVDTSSSNTNCGVCGNVCGASQTCVSGACRCSGGLTLCGSTCIDTSTSNANCGACGHACASGASCSGGGCFCGSGLTLCSAGCVDTSTSTTNCGTCGHACATGESCAGGVCVGVCVDGSACTTPAACGTGGQCVAATSTTVSPIVGLPGGATSISIATWSGGYCTRGVGTCDPDETGTASGCLACSTCVDGGTTSYCAANCTRNATNRGGCRSGYACDILASVCLPGCQSNDECRIRREDTNTDGAITTADSWVYDPASTATCSASTGRCTQAGVSTAHAGDTCTRASQCEANGICFQAAEGWPGGYCTKYGCDVAGFGCSGTTSVCQSRGIIGTGALCMRGCTVGAEPATDRLGTAGHGSGCRTRYTCLWNGTGASGMNGACVPGNYNSITVNNVGGACTADSDCYSPYGAGYCIDGGVWAPSNYCTIADCAAPGISSTACGTGNQCVDLGTGTSLCAKNCTSATTCSAGYACTDLDGSTATSKVCWPLCDVTADCRAGQTCNASNQCV